MIIIIIIIITTTITTTTIIIIIMMIIIIKLINKWINKFPPIKTAEKYSLHEDIESLT